METDLTDCSVHGLSEMIYYLFGPKSININLSVNPHKKLKISW